MIAVGKDRSFDLLIHKARYLGIGKSNFKIALVYVNKALAIYPDDLYAMRLKGYILGSMNKYSQSNKVYENVLRLDKTYADAYDGLAGNYAEKGNYKLSLTYMKKAMKHVDYHLESRSVKDCYYMNFAYIYYRMGDKGKAIRILAEGLKVCRRKKELKEEIEFLKMLK